MYRTTSRITSQQLPFSGDARRLLLEFYRCRDRQDADRYASGQQRIRGSVYAAGVARLEDSGDAYESYRVIRAAGIELSEATESLLSKLPQDWRQVCRVDSQGTLWTASLREKRASH